MTEEKKTNEDSKRQAQLAGEISAALKGRLDRAEKSMKIGLIVGTAVSLIVLLYMSVLYVNFSEVVEAESMADFVSNEVGRRVPELGSELESHLKAEAPSVADAVVLAFVNESIPALRTVIEEKLVESYEEAMQVGPKVLVGEVFTDMVAANKNAIRAAVKNEKTLQDPKAAADFEKRLIQTMERSASAGSKNQIASELKQSVAAVNNITAHLQDLSRKRQLTKRELLITNFISSWWTMLDSEKDDFTAEDVDVVQDNLKKSTEEIFEGTKDIVTQ
jgi:hypothetical protein